MSDTNNVVEVVTGEVEDNVITLRKPFTFEGTMRETIDLSGISKLKAKDMIEANKIMNQSGNFSIIPEMDLEYSLVIASRVSKLPIELFYELHPADALQVKNKITNFIYSRA